MLILPGLNFRPFFHTPSLAGDLVTFEDPSLGVMIKYPSNWYSSKIGQDQVTFIGPRVSDSPSFPAGLGIKSHNISSTDPTLKYIAEEIIKDLENDTPDFTLLSSSNSRLNNFDAFEIAFTATDDDGAKRTALQIVVKPDKIVYVYVIMYKAYPEKYESYLPIIHSRLNSLEFL